MTRLFVYGTLKRGCKNHRQLAGQTYLGEARSAPGFLLYDLGDFPGMVPSPGSPESVSGELWQVDAATLRRLDAFEGVHEGLYRRVPVPLVLPSGVPAADTYLYSRSVENLPVIGPVWRE